MRRLNRYPLRGAVGFGLGTFIALLPVELATPSVVLLAIAAFAGGALAAAVVTGAYPAESRCNLGFGIGYCILTFLVLFVHISIQGGGPPQYAWGAIGTATAFAVGGGLSALSIRPRLLLPGALAFGLAGLLGGPASFYLVYHGIRPDLLLALPLTAALAGALFGLTVQILGD